MNFSTAATGAADAPFDYAALAAMPDWRGAVAWPYGHREDFDLCQRIDRAQLRWLNDEPDETRRNIVLLGGGRLLVRVLAIAEMVLAVAKEAEIGVRLRGEDPDLAYLRGEAGAGAAPPAAPGRSRNRVAKPNHMALRRLRRVASWSSRSPWRFAATMLAPQATAISHNALLRDIARRGPTRVGMLHCEALYREIQDLAANGPETQDRGPDGLDGLESIIADFCAAVVASTGFGGDVAARFARLVEREARAVLPQAQRELRAARRLPALPDSIWSGTGGYWPNRCVSIEALRRGGRIRRFAHGSGPGLFEVAESIAFAELAVSTTYTLPTPGLARGMEEADMGRFIANYRRPKFDAGHGDPNIVTLDSRRREMGRRPAGSRRRVLYGPSILLGPRQLFPPLLPDPVHLDWQFRLVEALKRLPVDLICRPHPEGLLRGQRHPLAEITEINPSIYEDLLPEADVLVFDFGQSTTFCEALCSDRPVVFIDFGNPLFIPSVRAALERRCRIVRARFDERNRPQIDHGELSEAICGGAESGDPDEFRALFLGAS